MLVVVAEDITHTFNLGDGLGVVLRKASNDRHDGLGILRYRLADGCAAFLFGYGGDGAGVDDVDVCFLVEINYTVASLNKLAQQI